MLCERLVLAALSAQSTNDLERQDDLGNVLNAFLPAEGLFQNLSACSDFVSTTHLASVKPEVEDLAPYLNDVKRINDNSRNH